MSVFQNVTVTDIDPPITIRSEKGKTALLKDRYSWAISLCISGQITYTHRGKKFVSTRHNAVLLPKGATYSLHRDTDGLFPLIDFQCEGLESETFMLFPLRRPQELLNDYRNIVNLSLGGKRLDLFAAFYALLGKLDADQEEKHPVQTAAETYLKRSISDPSLTVRQIAAEAGVSESYLRKIFIARYGVPPKQVILNMRLQNAAQMLTGAFGEPARTVTAVSEACGFSSVYHFCRIFKEKTGHTPSEFANKNRLTKW